MSGRIAALLSQLGPKVPSALEDLPSFTEVAEVEPPFEETVSINEAQDIPAEPEPPADLRSYGYVQSLSRIESLLKNYIVSHAIIKVGHSIELKLIFDSFVRPQLQEDQKELEKKLWNARQGIVLAHEERARAARTQ